MKALSHAVVADQTIFKGWDFAWLSFGLSVLMYYVALGFLLLMS